MVQKYIISDYKDIYMLNKELGYLYGEKRVKGKN